MKQLSKELLTILSVGSFFYLLDITLHKDRYLSCWNIRVQVALWLHHIYYIFAMFGWLSKDKRILTLYCIAVVASLLHWAGNEDKCDWTLWLNKQCNTTGGLRTFMSYFKVGGGSHSGPKIYRRYQKIWYIVGLCIALYKLKK
jgi:hypothetical protein